MNYFKNFIIGGFIILSINFITLTLVTLYYDVNKIDVSYTMELLTIQQFSLERSSDGFGFVLMSGGIITSFLIGGIIGLLIRLITTPKKC